MKFTGNAKEYLQLDVVEKHNCQILKDTVEGSLSILWIQSGSNRLIIDGKEHIFTKNQIVFLTEFHEVEEKEVGKIRLLRFNRPFYCVIDHDIEVGCKGILFFGASQLPIIEIPDEDLEKFEILWKMFSAEMKSSDQLKIDMLRIMLQRYLILCTRLFKMQAQYPIEEPSSDIIREFNYLIEQHFRTKHSLGEYSKMLHKSPKTLSNIFCKMGSKSPLQYIHERIMLEARRLLLYSNKQIQEIAFEIGYDDIQSFSRFFKKHEGVSPTEFKGIA